MKTPKTGKKQIQIFWGGFYIKYTPMFDVCAHFWGFGWNHQKKCLVLVLDEAELKILDLQCLFSARTHWSPNQIQWDQFHDNYLGIQNKNGLFSFYGLGPLLKPQSI